MFGHIPGSSKNDRKGIAICLESLINHLGIIKIWNLQLFNISTFWKITLFTNVGARISKTYDLVNFNTSKNKISRKWFGIFLNYGEQFCGSKDKYNWFWESRTRPKIGKTWAWGVLGFSQSEIEKLLVPNEAE